MNSFAERVGIRNNGVMVYREYTDKSPSMTRKCVHSEYLNIFEVRIGVHVCGWTGSRNRTGPWSNQRQARPSSRNRQGKCKVTIKAGTTRSNLS